MKKRVRRQIGRQRTGKESQRYKEKDLEKKAEGNKE